MRSKKPEPFAARLQRLRAACGLTQQQLADRAGCHRTQVARYESGRFEPPLAIGLALAKILGAELLA